MPLKFFLANSLITFSIWWLFPGWRADEEDWERGGADLLRWSRQKGFPPLHRQPGHRVSVAGLYDEAGIILWVIKDHLKDQWMPSWSFLLNVVLNSFSEPFFRTLYCAKGNYDFGISRVIKSLEPYNKKVHHFNLSFPDELTQLPCRGR